MVHFFYLFYICKVSLAQPGGVVSPAWCRRHKRVHVNNMELLTVDAKSPL